MLITLKKWKDTLGNRVVENNAKIGNQGRNMLQKSDDAHLTGYMSGAHDLDLPHALSRLSLFAFAGAGSGGFRQKKQKGDRRSKFQIEHARVGEGASFEAPSLQQSR